MSLVETIGQHIVTAMKEKQADRLGVLRMIKSALKNQEIELGHALDDAAAVAVLVKLVKQRRESIEQFERGGRTDLADNERQELQVFEAYLPQAPSEAELADAIRAVIADTGATSVKDLGKVIKEVQSRFSGRPVDGKVLSSQVRDALAALA